MSQVEGLFGPMEEAQRPMRVSSEGVHLVRVAFENSGDRLYDYGVSEELAGLLKRGMRVRAPFGRGKGAKVGFCVAFPSASDVKHVKWVQEAMDESPLLSEELLDLANWISQYYCCLLGTVLSAMVPAAVKQQHGVVRRRYVRLTESGSETGGDVRGPKAQAVLTYMIEHHRDNDTGVLLDEVCKAVPCGSGTIKRLADAGWLDIIERRQLDMPSRPVAGSGSWERFELNASQQRACEQAAELIGQGTFAAMVLHGVTGSGKTEVYIRCIEQVIRSGRQALVLVPEIAMTPQTVERFVQRFDNVAILHSGLTGAERHKQWRWIRDGGVDVVVGARSAVFAPLSRLGMIIVDEEHEPSYKQDTSPRYHGRDAAIKRAQLNRIPILLGSATPSLETLWNSRTRQYYHLAEMPNRVMDLPLPQVRIVDMMEEQSRRKSSVLISRLLEQRLGACLDRGRQAILLLNRRGHSHFIYCPSCKMTLTCPNCDVGLTYHRQKRQFEQSERSWVMCHYCLYRGEVSRSCPVCRKKMILIGPGTQRAEHVVNELFARARVRRVDSDSIKPGELGALLKDFGEGNIDVLLGTQMVGKGLDFPNVDLVGVLNADTALSVPDFRSSERTFQLVAQVAGRCGRAGATGEVIVQSYQVDEPSIQAACRHDYETFSRRELELRRQCEMPPFSRLVRMVLRDQQLEKVERAGQLLRDRLDSEPIVQQGTIKIHGPMPAGIARLENYHRWQLIMKSQQAQTLQELLNRMRPFIFSEMPVQTIVDVDPMNLL